MTVSPAVAAQMAVAAAAAAADDTPSVIVGGVDRLTGDRVVTVTGGAARRSRWRHLVEVDVTGWVRIRQPSQALGRLQRTMSAVSDAVVGLRDAPDVHWMGWGADSLEWGPVDEQESDGVRWATADMTVTIAVDADVAPRAVGSAEQQVRAALADAGIAAVDASDRTPAVVTRWAGADPDDPARQLVTVWTIDELDAGNAADSARRVRAALDRSAAVAAIGGVDVDLAGAPPGSDGVHTVTEQTATLLL